MWSILLPNLFCTRTGDAFGRAINVVVYDPLGAEFRKSFAVEINSITSNLLTGRKQTSI